MCYSAAMSEIGARTALGRIVGVREGPRPEHEASEERRAIARWILMRCPVHIGEAKSRWLAASIERGDHLERQRDQ
jgi:hypothetical protein